jgi:hypothetical protein
VNRRGAIACEQSQRPFYRTLFAQLNARLKVRKILSIDELRGDFEH